MKRLASVIIAEAAYQNSTWPFVTIPAFEVAGASVRLQTGLELVLLCPLVHESNVMDWQDYSVQNAPTWMAESRSASLSASSRSAASGLYSSLQATDYIEGDATPTILDLKSGVQAVSDGDPLEFIPSVSNGGPYYFPIWMQSPAPFSPQLININFLSAESSIKPLLSAIMATGQPLLTQVVDMTSLSKLNIKFQDHERYHAHLVKYTSNLTTSTFQHPHAAYVHPVYANVNSEHHMPRLVALLVAILPFDRYLINLLPHGVAGLDAILKNGEQTFTYHLDGNSASAWALNREENDLAFFSYL
jgi:hypothetical protein